MKQSTSASHIRRCRIGSASADSDEGYPGRISSAGSMASWIFAWPILRSRWAVIGSQMLAVRRAARKIHGLHHRPDGA